MAVDIKFIAKKAGVSIATVSRVLNNTKKVSEPVRQKVLQTVQQYNYRPNTLARGLILNQTNLVGVVLPNVSDLYHARLLSSIEQCAEQYNYNVIVSNVYADFEKEKRSFEVFAERRVDGIVLLHENTPEEMQHLAALAEVPLVLANVNVPGCTLPSVAIDDVRAAFDAVSYLVRIGHTKIAGIFGTGHSLGTLRKQGYLQALQNAGITPNAHWVLDGAECSIKGGAVAVQALARTNELPTAIFCVADEIAIGAMDHLHKLGYEVPRDISVFGFDNISIAGIVRPRLSTVNQPVEEIGARAMKLLAALMRKTDCTTQIVLEHSLVLRDSCKNLCS